MFVKKYRLAVLTALLIQAASVGHGAVLDDVKIDTQNSIITLSGQLPVKKAGQMVGIEIFKDGVTRDTIRNASDSELSDMLIFVGQTFTNADGGYELSFKQASDSGNYVARIGYGKANKSHEKSYGFFNVNDIVRVLSEINAATDDVGIVDIIDKYGAYIGIDINSYADVSDKENVASAVLTARDTGFADIGAFVDVFEQAVLMQRINEASDAERILKLIIDNSQVFEEFSSYKAWKTLSVEGKNAVAKALFEAQDYTDIKTFFDSYNIFTVAQSIYRASSYGDVEDIIADNADFLGLDTDKYESLGNNKSTVWKKLAGILYDSADEIKDAFDDAVSAAAKKGTSSSKGGSGGGGSSLGGSVAVIPSIDKTPQGGEQNVVNEMAFNDLDGYE